MNVNYRKQIVGQTNEQIVCKQCLKQKRTLLMLTLKLSSSSEIDEAKHPWGPDAYPPGSHDTGGRFKSLNLQ